MTTDQIVLFTLLFFVFVLLIWGRWRYDLVAFSALLVALVCGVVPIENAFSGFGHPATVIIALVLVVSRGLSNSGAIELVARYVVDASRSVSTHIGILAGVGAALSAVMNNVGALALLMPVDLQAASNAKRSPALTLMPLSFATILGGLVTLIGTPPNIIVAAYRGEALGAPFKMFDFAPVGAACAVVGVVFVMTVGWRLIPSARSKLDTGKELFDLNDYIAEATVSEDSAVVGKQVRELDELMEEHELAVLGLIRRGTRLPGMARDTTIQAGDILVLEAGPQTIEQVVGALNLKYAGSEKTKAVWQSEDLTLMEVVVPVGARIEGRSALSLRLLHRHGITLLGVSRQGHRFRDRVRKLQIEAGDILLLLGPSERLGEITGWLGCLPLAERGLQVIQRRKAWLAVGLFVTAIALASAGVIYLPVALACTATLMVLLDIVPLRQLYESVEWPVIVLLGSMIPDRHGVGEQRRHRADRGGHRDDLRGLLPRGGADLAHGRHHDALRCDEQYRDRRHRRTHFARYRHTSRCERGPVLDGGRGGRLLRVPHTHRSQEQHAHHGTRAAIALATTGGWVCPWKSLIIAVGIPMILWVWPF